VKNNRRTSKIWLIEKEKLQNLLDSSSSICEVLRYFNLSPVSGNHRTLNKRIEEDNLSILKLNLNRKEKYSKQGLLNSFNLEDILIENSKYLYTNNLKKKLLKNNLLNNICYICNQIPIWNNKKLSLQLDHINGINNDNRIENLRILCPNCHSQTETYSGKNTNKRV